MAYNSNAFRKITGMKSQPSENSRQKKQEYDVSSGYNSGAFRSSLGLDISKTESSFADTMNSQKSVPSYRTPGDPELAKRYVHSGLEGMSQDAYMEAIQGYLDGTDMSDSAVRYRQRLNNSNQKRKQNYDDAIAERQKIQQQMSAFELGGRAWDDAEYKRLQNLLDQTDIKISTMEKYGDDRAYIDINNYNRSGSAAADKYSGYSGKYGASAMEAATNASGYDPAKDVLAQYDENKNWAPDISNRPNGEYLMSDFSNQYQQEGTKKHWDMLTDDERNTYYSVMAAEGQDAANKYLEEMQSALNKRFTDSQSYSKEDVQRMYQNTEHDPNWAPDISNRPNGEYLLSDFYDNQQGVLEHVTLNALSVPMSVFGGLPAFIDDTLNTLQGKEIDPYSNAHLAQNFATSIRSSTGEAINEATGAKETDFMTWGDVYQALMSSADSALGATLGGVGYGALMGMGAASSKAKELYDQGATNGQIIAASLAAGAAENVFETLSMELLLKRVVKYGAGGAKDFIKGVLVQGLGEGSEEFFTEISNTITDALLAYDFSEWAKDKEAYLKEHPGATDEEILANAIFGTGRRALQAAAAGAISGGFMGAGGTTVGYVNNRNTGLNLLNSSPSQLESIIYGASDVMEGYKNAKVTDKGYLSGKMEQAAIGKDVADIKAKYDAGTLSESDAAKLGKVSNVMQEAIMSQDVDKITSAVEDRLREKGVRDTYQGGDEVSTLARAVAKTVAGEKLLSWEKSAIKGSAEAKQVLQELGKASTEYIAEIDQKTDESQTRYDEATANWEAVQDDMYASSDAREQANQAYAEASQQYGEEQIDLAKDKSEVEWAGKIGARIVGDGRFSGNSVEGYSHLFGRHQKLFETAYQEGQDATQYTIDFAKAYNAGVNGENLEQLKANPASLSEVQVTAAYQAGQEAKKAANERNGINDEGTVHLRQSSFWQDGQNPSESAQGVESNAEQNQERNAESGGEEAAAGSTGAAEIRTGKVIKTQEELGIKNAKPGVKLTQVGSDFSEETKKASAMAKQTGVKVIFFTGGYLQLEDGRLARGMKQGDTIYLRADDPNFSASAIAGHESTHVLLDSGRLDRAAVLDALKGKYKAEDLNAFAADYFGTDATIDELIDEIICDAMGGMNAFAKSKGKAAFLQEVQGLAEKAIKETGTGVVDSSQKLSSVENDLKEGANPVDPGEIITDGVYVVSGDSKYSMVSMQSDIAEGTMFRDLLSHGIMTESDITKLKSDLESLLEYMRPNRNILDMNETYGREGRRFSPYKPNSDPLYKISMDFSTLCSKRLLTQYVIEQLQLRENRPMTAKEQMAIRAMLNDYRQQEKALQVACAMCYVEAARLKSPGQMEKWMNDPMSGMKDFFSKKNADFNKRVKDAQAKFKVDHGYAADTAKKGMKASDVTQLNKIGPKMRAEYQMSPEEAAIAERAAQLPRSTYLTAANLANLRDAEPEIYSAYTTFIRNATRSKALETDEPYYYGDSNRDNGNGVVVTDSFIESVNKENGMRFSSWSDWRIQHMLDYITAVIDNSVRGAAMHGYTKFTQEVRVLGKTGMMFNLSGVPGTQNGLNPDGSLSFSDTESIAVDQTGKSKNDALAMRDMFPETAGLQCIGVSDEHIHALLASDIIDYVIPYHTSGLNAALRRMAGIYGWKDYTNVQNAKIDSSIKGDSSVPGWHVEPVFSEFFVGYNTGMTGIEAMRKSAENYINMCRERGMTPKFEAFTGDENYWKLLIDRKMINQNTGKLIRQKPVKPVFDFAEIRKVVDETVENYDSGLESRALAYIVENWDSVGDKIKELEKAKKASKTKAVKNVDTLANEMLAAQQKAGEEQNISSVNEDLTAAEKYSTVNYFVDVNGNNYDNVVLLDRNVPKRVYKDQKRFITYLVNNLFGKKIPVIGADGNVEVLEFANANDTTKKNGKTHPVLGELEYATGDTRRVIITNLDEVAAESEYDPQYSNNVNSHDWLDANGWESRKTFVSDGVTIYEAYLKIAKAHDGRNILYAVNCDVKNGVAVDKGATQKRAAVLAATPSTVNVTQSAPVVKQQFSIVGESAQTVDRKILQQAKAMDVESRMRMTDVERADVMPNRFSTVNSTQLALENPDVYDEIQTTYEDILKKTKGKDLAAALQAEAQKHQADLQMWEHEATVLERLWKQSEKNVDRLDQALGERRERIAEVNDQLKERRRDVRTIEKEFLRVVREWEKQHGKLEGKTEEAASLKQALAESLKAHKADNATWGREYDRLTKMYERADRKIDRLEQDIERRKEMAAKSVEGRKRTVIRNKILDLNKDFQRILDHPEKGITAHAPRSLIKPLAEFCSMFANAEWGYRGEQLEKAIANGNSQVRIDQISRAQALMAQISKRYEDLASAAGVQGASYQQGTADQIKQATDIMAEMFNYKSIHDMTSDELDVIYKAMKSIMHSIKTANQLSAMETTRTMVETVNHLNQNLNEAVPASKMPARFAQRYQMWQMSPHTFWNYICGYAKGNVGQDIDRMFMHGTERMLGVQRDFDNAFNPILNQNEAEIKRMTSTKEKDLVTIGLKDLNGNDVKMTRGMRLSAYMLLNQEDSLRSLAYGGFKLPRMDEYYHGSIASAYGGGDEGSFYTTAQGATISEAAHTLQELKKELRTTTDVEERAQLHASIDAAEDALNNLVEGEEARLNDIREAIWADMTDYEKQLVRAANEWMEHSGNLMQEVYYELNGFDPARVRNYWPIHRDPTTIQSLDTTAVVNEFNLANSGFTKERVRASNPILLTDFFQELLSNKNKMSRYYGFAVAQRDFNKLYKFKAPGSQSSVEQRIAAKFQTGNASFGVTGTQYIENYIKAVSGANTAESTWLSGLYSMAAGSTLSANLRVAISQLASIPTAASVVGWGNAAKGFVTGIGSAFSRSAKDQLANDSVWFYQRYKGEGSTREIADMRQSGGPIAKAMSSKYGKLFFNWCQNMDVLATGPIMWNMARSAVLETGMNETDLEFKQAVQDKYADIIRFSQPNYTETERSDLLRDKRTASKILTMYKTQSNQNLNLLIDASMEMRKMKADYKAGKNGVTEADVKAATAKFANAYTGVLIGGTLAFALMRFIGNVIQRTMNAYRDDDTDEVTAEGIFNGIMKDVLSSVAGMLAGGSIIYDGIYSIASGDRYYGISDSAVGMLSDTSESLVNAFKAAGTDKFPDKAIKALMNAARMAGIPASNVQKLGSAVIGWGKAIATGNAFDDGNATAAQVNARYVNAVLAGDAEKSGAILSQLIADEEAANDYEAEKKVLSTISSYLKPKYQDGSLSKDQTMKVLLQSGMEKADAEAKINSWSGKIETGYTADAIKKAYKAGDVSAEELINYLVKYEGKTKDSARKTELELRCVRETGIEFSSIKSMAVRGLISRDYAVQLLVKYGGKTKEQAQKTVDKYFS